MIQIYELHKQNMSSEQSKVWYWQETSFSFAFWSWLWPSKSWIKKKFQKKLNKIFKNLCNFWDRIWKVLPNKIVSKLTTLKILFYLKVSFPHLFFLTKKQLFSKSTPSGCYSTTQAKSLVLRLIFNIFNIRLSKYYWNDWNKPWWHAWHLNFEKEF